MREIAHVAQVANGGGYLEVAFRRGGGWNQGEGQRCGLGYLHLERPLAANAGRCGTAELNKIAVVAAQDLTLFNGRHHGCHKLCRSRAVARAGYRSTRPITEACDAHRVALVYRESQG